ncbi:hypothetical protein SAMN05446037_102178 [Anaerovirgula multivorans]|uniref:Uncharacterized protein n=1 Tax=Anaerovirgula multivorans TaxID=312168 RepID=A0A239HFR1_9FIRM|nr:hypothetical protein SAMN05446037_102178 [Anaerovirgula multivorans]
MHFFIYNLIRVINIMDIKELIGILRAKKTMFFWFLKGMRLIEIKSQWLITVN